MERFCFPPIPFHTRPVCCIRKETNTKESVLFPQCNARKSVLLFAVQKPPFFVLRRVSPEYPLQTYTLNDCLFTFSLSRGDIFTPLQSAQDTRTITTIMAGEEETETFAFQAEINQLLSLIINVRSGTCFVCDVPLPESVVFFLFPRKSFHRDTSVFSLVSSYAR
jgi:hypothetical protein